MLPDPASPFVAGAFALVVTAFFMVLGHLISSAIFGRRLQWWGHTGMAFAAVCFLSTVMTLVHYVTGGAVFSSPWVTRAVVAVVLAGCLVVHLRRRRTEEESTRPDIIAIGVLLAMSVILWSTPIFRMMALDHVFDTDIHAGWTQQLMYGDPLPNSTITGDVPNFYPWLFHGFNALVSHFVLGGHAMHALPAMQLLQVAGIVAALYAVGRALTERWLGGAATALLGAMTGGFAIFLTQEPAVVINSRGNGGKAALRYMGDLIAVRPYNTGFQNLPPPLPRDVTYALVVAGLFLLIVGMRRNHIGLLVGAGVTMGLVGLTAGETMFLALGAGGLAALLAWPGARVVGRLKAIGAVVIPSLAVWSLWLVPILMNYMKYGGFRNSVNSNVTLTAPAVLFSFGITTAFAVFGLVVWLPKIRSDAGVRAAFAFTVVAIALLAIPAVVPIPEAGFKTLGRQHRYWPLLYLGIAVIGGLGMSTALAWLEARKRQFFLAAIALILVLALPSPLLGSLAIPDERGDPPILAESMTGGDTWLNAISNDDGDECIAAVPLDWSHWTFSYTGYKLVMYRWTKRVGANSAHLRWFEIYEHIPGTRERMTDMKFLISGLPRDGVDVSVEKYGVDLIVTPVKSLRDGAFEGYEVEPVDSMAVVRVDDCGDAESSRFG